eukprot:scaffold2379_cov124-Isochrysis_galbana.AAC.2
MADMRMDGGGGGAVTRRTPAHPKRRNTKEQRDRPCLEAAPPHLRRRDRPNPPPLVCNCVARPCCRSVGGGGLEPRRYRVGGGRYRVGGGLAAHSASAAA